MGGPGRLPSPPPRSVAGAVGGRGGAGGPGPAGDLEQGRGDLCLVSWAGLIRGCIWKVYTADSYGESIWQPHMAGLFGGSKGLICQRLKARKHCKVNEIEKKGIY